MAANVVEFTDANFETEVLQASEPVLVDFGAPWCMPCQMLAPTIEALAEQYAGKARVGTVNTDQNQRVASRYHIAGLPTILIFKRGEVVDTFMGPRPQKVLSAALDKHLAAEPAA